MAPALCNISGGNLIAVDANGDFLDELYFTPNVNIRNQMSMIRPPWWKLTPAAVTTTAAVISALSAKQQLSGRSNKTTKQVARFSHV